MEQGTQSRRWYAVRTRSNFERKAHAFCTGHQLETFLPTYRQKSRKHGGPKYIDRPLFPGYFFARVDLRGSDRVTVLRAPGAVEYVRFGRTATPIPDKEIESVRIVTTTESGAAPHPFLREGAKVRVIAGPFRGAVGILKQTGGDASDLIVSIELLGRSVGVPIDAESVEPILA